MLNKMSVPVVFTGYEALDDIGLYLNGFSYEDKIIVPFKYAGMQLSDTNLAKFAIEHKILELIPIYGTIIDPPRRDLEMLVRLGEDPRDVVHKYTFDRPYNFSLGPIAYYTNIAVQRLLIDKDGILDDKMRYIPFTSKRFVEGFGMYYTIDTTVFLRAPTFRPQIVPQLTHKKK
jgi:hypothetical protein